MSGKPVGTQVDSARFDVQYDLLIVLVLKTLPANAGDIRDVGSVPWSGRSPAGGHGNPLQHSCLENPMDTGARRARVHGGCRGSDMTEATLHTRTGSFMTKERRGVCLPPLEQYPSALKVHLCN